MSAWRGLRSRPLLGAPAAKPIAGRDEQIGKIFRNMRSALKVPRDAFARRLATSTAVIDSFEAGAIMRPAALEGNRAYRAQLLRAAPLRSGARPVALAQPVSGWPPTTPGRRRNRRNSAPLGRAPCRLQGGRFDGRAAIPARAPSPQGPYPVCAEHADCVCRRTRLLGPVGIEARLSGHCACFRCRLRDRYGPALTILWA